ncbi:hypothetical protein MESS4_590096 [Mesorhizobium sp. STM 4661]|nr:hypothetical protein MESS4_590096 [Mesorhizobium sp. STM 4661]
MDAAPLKSALVVKKMKFTSYGLDMSTPIGSTMTDVMDGRPDLNPWKDFNWPAIPGYFGRPWFLPVLGAYYRMKDLVG